jgi:hypothetical protein
MLSHLGQISNNLAFLGIDTGMLIPIIIFMIPIVAILTKHQQKMAELIHGQHGQQGQQNVNPNASFETSQLREEVRQLRELMTQQTLALDNLRDEVKVVGSLQSRINENS